MASVAVDIDGIQFEIHGIQTMRVAPTGTRIELPMFRDTSGISRAAITLPEEVSTPLGASVLDALIEL